MLRLDFSSRGFDFCAYCAAFARVVILSARGVARFWQATARRDFSELRILRASGAVLRFKRRDFADWRRERGFQTATL